MLKKNIQMTQNYEFNNIDESCRFVMNQNMFFFEKEDFKGYNNINKYLDLFIAIIDIIKEYYDIKISRVGIRKINEIILNDIKSIQKYFKSYYFKDLSSLNEESNVMLEYSFRPYYGNNSISLNKNIKVFKGKYKDNSTGKNIDAYSCIWDIDCYKRFNYEEYNMDLMKQLCLKINNKIFKEYTDVISDDLYNVIITNNSPSDIIGGLIK